MFESLPLLCVFKIAECIGKDKVNIVAQTAATLSLICGAQNMVNDLWNIVDPGCHDKMSDTNALALIVSGKLTLSSKDLYTTLKKTAKALNIPGSSSASKAKLVASINTIKMECARKAGKLYQCPVRKMPRELVQSLNKPSTIRYTDAKKNYRLKRADLKKIPYAIHTRHAFLLSDIIKASMDKYGPKYGPMTPEFVAKHAAFLQTRRAAFDALQQDIAHEHTTDELCTASSYTRHVITQYLTGGYITRLQLIHELERATEIIDRVKRMSKALESSGIDVVKYIGHIVCREYTHFEESNLAKALENVEVEFFFEEKTRYLSLWKQHIQTVGCGFNQSSFNMRMRMMSLDMYMTDHPNYLTESTMPAAYMWVTIQPHFVNFCEFCV